MARKCQSCGVPLWLAWLFMGRPWRQRERRFADARDCIDLLEIGAWRMAEVEAHNHKSGLEFAAHEADQTRRERDELRAERDAHYQAWRTCDAERDELRAELEREVQRRLGAVEVAQDNAREAERLRAENQYLRKLLSSESMTMNTWQLRYREWVEAGRPPESSQT